MMGDKFTVEIISRNDLKVGDFVLFSCNEVLVKAISCDSWTFGNDDIGDLTMPLYFVYYRIIQKWDEE